ncbi:MAG: hypothetical protein E6Q97_28960 [Desulfurellales bacterium]|mgnify:CR=1 FL=1|nr:MAG: hypothetical protein E6Q97_28960 [Desulfurellales bacterium]
MPISNGIPWVQTYLGRQLRMPEFNGDAINLVETATVLSRICRFGGRTEVFYSVAEHSVRCALFVRDAGYSLFEQFYALNHEGDESLLGFDPPSPLLRLTPDLRQLKHAAHTAYMTRYGLPIEMPAIVKIADAVLLSTEKRDLMKTEPMPWYSMPNPMPATIVPWSMQEAAERFLSLWHELSPHGSPPSDPRGKESH